MCHTGDYRDLFCPNSLPWTIALKYSQSSSILNQHRPGCTRTKRTRSSKNAFWSWLQLRPSFNHLVVTSILDIRRMMLFRLADCWWMAARQPNSWASGTVEKAFALAVLTSGPNFAIQNLIRLRIGCMASGISLGPARSLAESTSTVADRRTWLDA